MTVFNIVAGIASIIGAIYIIAFGSFVSRFVGNKMLTSGLNKNKPQGWSFVGSLRNGRWEKTCFWYNVIVEIATYEEVTMNSVYYDDYTEGLKAFVGIVKVCCNGFSIGEIVKVFIFVKSPSVLDIHQVRQDNTKLACRIIVPEGRVGIDDWGLKDKEFGAKIGIFLGNHIIPLRGVSVLLPFVGGLKEFDPRDRDYFEKMKAMDEKHQIQKEN